MEWIDDLNDVMTYIEKHLTDEISYDELAKLAHCSTYHFQRMFSYMAGVPLSEYIRRRRMSLNVFSCSRFTNYRYESNRYCVKVWV